MIRKIINRLKNIVAKAVLSAVNDSGEIQLVKIQGYEGEIADAVERIQNYGLTSVPPKGGEAIVLNVGANSDHPVVVAMDSGEFRKKNLKPGEVALYDKNKSYILLREDGSIEIKSSKNYIIDGEKLFLGGENLTPLAGVVTGECLDPVTGVPFPDKSSKVFAAK